MLVAGKYDMAERLPRWAGAHNIEKMLDIVGLMPHGYMHDRKVTCKHILPEGLGLSLLFIMLCNFYIRHS